jgi:hypothetical protein
MIRSLIVLSLLVVATIAHAEDNQPKHNYQCIIASMNFHNSDMSPANDQEVDQMLANPQSTDVYTELQRKTACCDAGYSNETCSQIKIK